MKKKKQKQKTSVTGVNGKRKVTEGEKIVQRLRWSSIMEPYQPDLLTTNRTLIALGLHHVYDSYKYIVKIQYTLRCTVGMLHISPIAF